MCQVTSAESRMSERMQPYRNSYPMNHHQSYLPRRKWFLHLKHDHPMIWFPIRSYHTNVGDLLQFHTLNRLDRKFVEPRNLCLLSSVHAISAH